jgi:hypothetical protein
VTGTHFQVELFRISNDPHDQSRFARRVEVPWTGRQVSLPTPEDVIITKLRWLTHLKRNKDWDDVRQVISVQQGKLDLPYLERWCDEHGTRQVLNEIREAIPPA